MVLEGENDGVVRGDKGTVSDGNDGVFEEDVCAHGLAVGDDGLFILSFAVPTVQLNTPEGFQLTAIIKTLCQLINVKDCSHAKRTFFE